MNNYISTAPLYDSTYLAHHGIKGQKWGVRKDRQKYASNYSAKQRAYDKKIYGEFAVQRINKRMANGEGIKSARHNEVKIKERKNTAKKVAKIAAKTTLATAGAIVLTKFLTSKGIDSVNASLINEGAINAGKAIINNIFV